VGAIVFDLDRTRASAIAATGDEGAGSGAE